MGGCFGNTPIDKYLERQVDEHNGNSIQTNKEKEDEENDDDFVGDLPFNDWMYENNK